MRSQSPNPKRYPLGYVHSLAHAPTRARAHEGGSVDPTESEQTFKNLGYHNHLLCYNIETARSSH